jgi:biofilm protein TabA
MIIDNLHNWRSYPYGVAWQQAMTFLHSLTIDAEEREYILPDHGVTARVMRYQTRRLEASAFETHIKYIDIQALLSGQERIVLTSVDGLTIDKPYDATSDIAFYHYYPTPSHLSAVFTPGRFGVFFPQDAHMPGVMADTDSEDVKKVVIKVPVGALQG